VPAAELNEVVAAIPETSGGCRIPMARATIGVRHKQPAGSGSLAVLRSFLAQDLMIHTMPSGPSWISWLTHPAFAGAIGLARLPGKRLQSLAEDLAEIRAAGATTLVTLNEWSELRRVGHEDFPAEVTRAGLAWHHLPIRDFGIPDTTFELAWHERGPRLRQRLRQGDAIVIHCYAGLGRSGLVAARLLIEFGESPERAIERVRDARPGSVQTAEQEDYLFDFAFGLRD
jgi:ADP-ribosyl-[dinitrogen reductase] hydrolase